jgi:predicted dehydrogenase
MTDETRVGVIGCGFFAQNHLHAWSSLRGEGARIVAVCDIDPAKAKAAAANFEAAHWYTDPERMLGEQNLGLVDIVTRMDTHRELVELAVRHRTPSIVQKPVAPTLADARAMAAAAEAAGIFLAVHENFRFQTPMRKARELIAGGAIGEPTWARISFRTGYDIYSGQPYLREEERFIITDLGAHVLDLARVFLGEVDRIAAETQSRNPDVKGEDTATMMLRHVSGAVSVVDCTYESRRLPDPFPETLIEIEGTKGALAIRRGLRLELTSGDRMTEIDVDPPVLEWASRPWHVVQESVLATCAHMLVAIQSRRPAQTSGTDNVKTFALCEAAYAAASTHCSIPADQFPAMGEGA